MKILTATEQRVMDTLTSLGGEANGYANREGLNRHSIESLIRAGLLERVPPCASCATNAETYGVHGKWDDGECARPLAQSNGNRCYRRVRITAQSQER